MPPIVLKHIPENMFRSKAKQLAFLPPPNPLGPISAGGKGTSSSPVVAVTQGLHHQPSKSFIFELVEMGKFAFNKLKSAFGLK